MKIQYFSDVHNEMNTTFRYEETDADVVVMAGDIDTGNGGLKWALENIKDKPVLYVLGNHEFYAERHPDLVAQLKQQCVGTNISVLEKDTVTINGVHFHGCTLWTGYAFHNQVMRDQAICNALMSDYHYIRDGISGQRITPERTVEWHQESVEWLNQALSQYRDQCNVVISHHAPHANSLSPFSQSESIAAAYVSDQSTLIAQYQPALWIHGHVHRVSRYGIGNCTIVCNPGGSGHYVDKFNPRATVQITQSTYQLETEDKTTSTKTMYIALLTEETICPFCLQRFSTGTISAAYPFCRECECERAIQMEVVPLVEFMEKITLAALKSTRERWKNSTEFNPNYCQMIAGRFDQLLKENGL